MWQNDMCIDSCVGLTGPYANPTHCPHPRCGKPRYDQRKLERSGGKTKVPLKTFTTFPLGPPSFVGRVRIWLRKMHYRRNTTADILRKHADGTQDGYDDILGAMLILTLWRTVESRTTTLSLCSRWMTRSCFATRSLIAGSTFGSSWTLHLANVTRFTIPSLVALSPAQGSPRTSTLFFSLVLHTSPHSRRKATHLGWLRSHGRHLIPLSPPSPCRRCRYGRA